MTYRQQAERIQRPLAGGDIPEDFPIEPEEIYLAITTILPYLAKVEFYQSYQISERIIDATYLMLFQGVKVYSDTKPSYCVLPGSFTIIHGRGRPQVLPVYNEENNNDLTYVYTEPGRLSIVKGAKLTDYSGVVRFWSDVIQTPKFTQTRFYFDAIPPNVEAVNIRCMPVPDLVNIDPDSPIPVAPHLLNDLHKELLKIFDPEKSEPEEIKSQGVYTAPKNRGYN